MDVEELRRALRDAGSSPAIEAVSALEDVRGRAHRARRRSMVSALALMVAIGVIVALIAIRTGDSGQAARVAPARQPASSTTASGSGRATGVVPWLNERATEPPTIPQGTPLCDPSALRIAAVTVGPAAGTIYANIDVTNTSSSGCVLDDQPSSATAVDEAGDRVPLRVTEIGPPHKTYVSAGGTERLWVTWQSYCGAITGADPTTHRVTDPAFEFVRGELRLPDLVLNLCNDLSVGVGSQEQPQTPAPGTIATLGVSMALPSQIHAGSRVKFVVTLTNDSNVAVPLEPCPVYKMGVQGGAYRAYRLNCADAHSIPAQGSVRFAMSLVVPAGAAGGLKASWGIVPDGPSTATDISLT